MGCRAVAQGGGSMEKEKGGGSEITPCRCANRTALEVILAAVTTGDDVWLADIRKFSLRNEAFLRELLQNISAVSAEILPKVQNALRAALDG